MAGLEAVPCLEVDGELDEADLLADQVIENTVRNSLPPLQLARALAKLKSLKGVNSFTLAKEIGLSPATLSRSEALLSLPEDIQEMVDQSIIPESSAYELSRLPDAASQLELAQAVAGGLSRERLIEAVRGKVPKRKVTPKAGRLAFRLGGIAVSVSAAQPLTQGNLTAIIARIRQESKKLPAGEEPSDRSDTPDPGEMAQVLKAS